MRNRLMRQAVLGTATAALTLGVGAGTAAATTGPALGGPKAAVPTPSADYHLERDDIFAPRFDPTLTFVLVVDQAGGAVVNP